MRGAVMEVAAMKASLENVLEPRHLEVHY